MGRWGRVRFHGVSWYEDSQFLVGINLSPPPQTGVKRESAGGQWRRRQWADTRVPRYDTVRGTNRPSFPTHGPESDEDWDRLYYGGTNAVQERGSRGTGRGRLWKRPPGMSDSELEKMGSDPAGAEEWDEGSSEWGSRVRRRTWTTGE